MTNTTISPIRAVIRRVVQAKPSAYIIAYPENGDVINVTESITCNIENWRGETPPDRDQVVLFEGLQLFRHGWRASIARPIVLDTTKTTRKE